MPINETTALTLRRPDTAVATIRRPNSWDWAMLPIVLAILAALAFAASQMTRPYEVGQALAVSTDPSYLPYYLMRTMARMAAAMLVSLAFSMGFAAAVTRWRTAEKVLVPVLDILQSIPILGFLSITVTGFIALFPGSLLGVECAAIFAIFTSQAWNMAFSLYQSLRTVPSELREAAEVFRLSGWQRFWRLEMPYALPPLLWNMMMSMSGGWFFVVASEAISVSHQDIKLPGIGSYIALAIERQDLAGIGWSILAMLVGIVIYDQLLFRPLLAWADKFRFEESQGEDEPQSWLLDWLRRSQLFRDVSEDLVRRLEATLRWFPSRERAPQPVARPVQRLLPYVDHMMVALAVLAGFEVLRFISTEAHWREIGYVLLLGLATLARVMVLIALASLIWVPAGIWIGLRPKWAQRLQPVAQFMAAFPANLLFPLAVMAIARLHLNPEIWLSPLMIFGTQWYILFNVVAGAASIPTELRLAAQNLGLSGWTRWRRYLLPAVFPGFVTGAITASGGSWNASIVSEWVSWGDTCLVAHGLGSYIAEQTSLGDFPRIALGIGVMCLFVTLLNRFVWRRLYALAEAWSR